MPRRRTDCGSMPSPHNQEALHATSVACCAHANRLAAARPVQGELMLHDAAGNTVASRTYRLAPGQIAFLDFTPGTRVAGAAIGSLGGIDPCLLRGPDSARAVPSVQVFDTVSGRTSFVLGPAAARRYSPSAFAAAASTCGTRNGLVR